MPDPGAGSKTILFTDMRHIRVGNIKWCTEAGDQLPVAGPPEPPVELHAEQDVIPRGIRFVAQSPTKMYDACITGPRGRRVTYEGGIYRSWALRAEYPPKRNLGSYSRDVPTSVNVVYSESNDAFEWVEKARCPVELPGQTGVDGCTYFIDPKAAPDERYKIVYCAVAPVAETDALRAEHAKLHPRHRDWRMLHSEGWELRCVYTIVSADGIDWRPVPKPLMVLMSDTDTTVTYNEWLDRYVMYTRLFPHSRRAIAWAEAEDFYDWGPVQPLIWCGLDCPLTDDIYLNAYTQYPGLPQYHLMFPMVYHRYDQTSDILLYTSDTGVHWNRVPGGPILRPGEPGTWDSEFIHVGKDMVPLGNDRVGVPYHGTPYPHKYPRWESVLSAARGSWAWWPAGRICGIKADLDGEFSTLPMKPGGRELRLNVSTPHAGEVRVGISGVEGRSVADCTPVIGDSLAAPVHWGAQSDIGVEDGRSVVLHFKLRDASLFGFEWV